MFIDILRRAFRPVLLAAILSVVGGCTALVSEKPIFKPADYDTSDALIGRYLAERNDNYSIEVLITRGPDGRLAALGFRYEAAERAEDKKQLAQLFYADGAAIALGGGDYVLQVACYADIQDGKAYASEIGGKDSPFRGYTGYGTIAQDRREDHVLVSASFRHDLLDKYTSESREFVRIIPSDIARPAAVSLFRDLIAREMKRDGSPTLVKKYNSNPQPSDEEERAIVLNDAKECRRMDNEGIPAKDAPPLYPPPPPN